MAGRPGAGQPVLHDVRVLELVDQDVLEALLVAGGDGWLRREQFQRAAQQVVEIDRRVLAQRRLIALEAARHDLLAVVAGVGAHGLGAQPLVLGARDGAQHAPGRVVAGIDRQLFEGALDDGDLVVVVIDDEAAGHADRLAVGAQDAGADGVEGAQPHAARAQVVGAAGQQRLDAGAHLAGGLVGEGDGQDAPGRHPRRAHQPGDAVGDDARLARARSGQDEQRAGGPGHGLALGGVEAVEVEGGEVGPLRGRHGGSVAAGPGSDAKRPRRLSMYRRGRGSEPPRRRGAAVQCLGHYGRGG